MANGFWGHSLNNKQPIRNHNKIVDLLPATVWALWHATCKSCLLLEPGGRPPSEKMIIMCCGKDGMTLFAFYTYIIRHITIIYISMHHYASKYILLDWTINYLNVWLTKLLLHSISSLCHFIRNIYIYINIIYIYKSLPWFSKLNLSPADSTEWHGIIMLYEVPAPNSYEIRILGQSRHIKKEALFYKGVGEKRKTQIESSWPPGLFSYKLKELSFYSPPKVF